MRIASDWLICCLATHHTHYHLYIYRSTQFCSKFWLLSNRPTSIVNIFFLCSVLYVPPSFCLLMFSQGTLIQHLKEHILHGNMCSSDVIFYYTTVSRCTSHGLSIVPPTHTHTHTHTSLSIIRVYTHLSHRTTYPHTYTLGHTHSLIASLSPCSHTPSLTHSLTHTLPHSHTPSLTHSSHAPLPSLTYSLTHTLPHTLAHCLL